MNAITPLKDHTLRPIDPSMACIGAGYWDKSVVRNFHALGRLACVGETSEERRAELAAASSDAACAADEQGCFGLWNLRELSMVSP